MEEWFYLHIRPSQPRNICVFSGDSHHIVSVLPRTKGRMISTVDQWTSAYLVFGVVYAHRFPEAASGRFKYCDVVRQARQLRGGNMTALFPNT